jgi:hypothetical protein
MRCMSPGMLQAVRPACLGAPIAACALTVWGIASWPARADDAAMVLPLYGNPVLPHHSGAAERNLRPNIGVSDPAQQTRPAIEFSKVNSRFAVIELPREQAATPGGTSRPHHAFGYRWHGAESWLRENGLEAETCYLPMVRLHSKFSVNNGASGTLWVYGRCSFK